MNGELSAEQRARISQNFRAAKALLARKRPRRTSLPGPHTNSNADNIDTLTMADCVKRAPLSDIPVNTPSPVSRKQCSKLVGLDSYHESCSKDCSVSKTNTINSLGKALPSLLFDTPVGQKEFSSRSYSNGVSSTALELVDANLNRREKSAHTEDGVGLNSLFTPSRPLGYSSNALELVGANSNGTEKSVHTEDGVGLNSFFTPLRPLGCSSSTDPTMSSNDLDDRFDESVLEQIDALCKQKSAAKSEREGASISLVGNQNVEKESGECDTNQSPVLGDEMQAECSLGLSSDKECIAEGPKSSVVTKTKSMPEEYMKYIHSLNDRQEEAACSDISIPLMIIAGPGSGKTSTMVGRVLMLMSEGIGPSHILAMTFTTAAVSEMRERIGTVAGKAAAKELTISTFHSFSLQLCRSHAEKLGRTPEFLIYGHGQQRKAITEAIRLLEDGKKMLSYELPEVDRVSDNSLQYFKDKSKKWLTFIAKAKAAGRTPEDFKQTGKEMEAAVLQNYSDILQSCNALDYHDLISCSVKLLTDFPEVFKECQETWRAIVIDEFQDTSAMQYDLLHTLASHKCITVIGDDDQSIFSFNGADVSGFDSFRKDFPQHKEIRLNKNYRSTRCIVEAASHLIQNNLKRCKLKSVLTDNTPGSKITVKECCNEAAQCAFVVDKILEIASDGSSDKRTFGNIAVLYRRQVSGKMFQTAFRSRKIPFNIHGVAFYRKKVARAIIAMLKTTLPGCDDGAFRRVFKALLPLDKVEKNKIIEHIDKVSTVRKCSFISAACDIFSAKISGTFKRSQLTQGRKVLLTLDVISKLVHREQSISAVINSVANMIPQKYLIEQRAVLDVDGGKLLNEDHDLRSVLQYLLDDVSNFITQYIVAEEKSSFTTEGKGSTDAVKAFIDYISEREAENFQCRRCENKDSVTLTTIHQSKGLEWDTVFIVKANESEIPLLHEFNGVVNENGTSIEEERRLLYVAMTRARKKLFILYLTMDSNWQVLQPSRFLREIPRHLLDTQDELDLRYLPAKQEQIPQEIDQNTTGGSRSIMSNEHDIEVDASLENKCDEEPNESTEACEAFNGNNFLRRFSSENRGVISRLFHQWAKKPAFQEPKRLLDKVAFVIDERLSAKKTAQKDVLRELKTCIRCDEAFHYAKEVLQWEQMPADKRAYLMREKQEHFQRLRMETAMGSSAPTSKQIAYLQNLGCTVVPTTRLHASRLIEEYKSL